MNWDAYFETLALIPNYRSARFNDLDVKENDRGRLRFTGHAAVFDEDATIGEHPEIGVLTESVDRGAFRKVLSRRENIPFTIEHDPGRVLATTGSGLLKLEEDGKGLSVDADVPPTQMARDLKELVDSDVVAGMSFGFLAGRGFYKIEQRSNGRHRRLVGFKKLLDVCATWDPTYRSAEAEFRSALMANATDPETMQLLYLGAYPQPVELRASASTEEDREGDAAETTEGDASSGDGDREGEGVGEEDVPERRVRSLAANRAKLMLIELTLKEEELDAH